MNDASSSIDEARREAFEQGWLVGPRQPIEQCLPDESDSTYLATLEELVCIDMEFAWRDYNTRRYATLSGPVASTVRLRTPADVESYCRRFPALMVGNCQTRLIQQEFAVRRRFQDSPTLHDYEERFPDLPIGEILKSDAVIQGGAAYEVHDSDQPSPDERSLPEVPGYRLERRIGMGGMGVVYRARQIAADRVVAVKLIRTDRLETLDPEEQKSVIDRLSVEAQATARLDHPHVVSLFEVNTDDPMRPWFSMQFVDGETLAQQLQQGPVASREAADLIRQVVEALECAHDAGVLHRDLKPQNIFLRNADGQVLVGDFGLAKLTLDDARRTSHEEILGTPAYMSPEQIRDSSTVTEAADLWSIGATLYHLLTGRPPFQAATSLETLRQVLELEPISPRQLNPGIPRDLETICLKCLQKNPQHRYASSAALREDIEACLAHRPIAARPVGALEKTARWCRRNPRPASFAGLAIFSIAAAFVALLAGYRTADSALKQSLASLTREREARQDADSSHTMARQTVDDLFTEVSETVLLNKPGMQPLRRRLLNRTLQYYRRFAESGRHTPAMQSILGHVWFRIGVIEHELGNEKAADDALQSALVIQTRLSSSDTEPDHRLSLSTTLNALGRLRLSQRNLTQSREMFQKARNLRQQLLDSTPADPELRRLYANTVMNIGAVDRNAGQFDAAMKQFEAAAALYRRLLEEDDGHIDSLMKMQVQRELAKALFNSANAAIDLGTVDFDSVLLRLREAELLMRIVLETEVDSYPDRRRLAWCLQLTVECAADTAEAQRCADLAVAELQRLVGENRSVPELVIELAQAELTRGRLAADISQYQLAVDAFESAVDHLESLQPGASDMRDRDLSVARAEAALAHSAAGSATSGMISDALAGISRQLAIHADDEELLLLQRQLRQAEQSSTKRSCGDKWNLC